MADDPLQRVTRLTFDIFGTVLDLTGTIVPALEEYLAKKNVSLDAGEVWKQWRTRQRIEQHQDTILMLGHSGYLEVARRALAYTLRHNGVAFEQVETHQFIKVFERLEPFEDAKLGLARLAERYQLIALSNGNQHLLDPLVDKIGVRFEARLSVERWGRFKPHPSVYRGAASVLGFEPGEAMMVAAHSFDVHGARACGYRGAFVNRYRLPYEQTALIPDVEVNDFLELCERLGA